MSIATVRQETAADGERGARLVIVTHAAPDAALAATVEPRWLSWTTCAASTSVLRVEDLGRPVARGSGG